MKIVLELEPEIEAALREKAKTKGFEVNAYIEKLILEDLKDSKTFDEILAPI